MANKLTDKQETFARLVVQGVAAQQAATIAGYAFPSQDAYSLMRHKKVSAVIRERRQARINGELAGLAMNQIKEIIGGREEVDPDTGETTKVYDAPASVRFNASKWILENAGHTGASDTGEREKDLSEMDADELARAVQSGMQALTELAGQLEGHHVIDGHTRQIKELPAIEEDTSFLD